MEEVEVPYEEEEQPRRQSSSKKKKMSSARFEETTASSSTSSPVNLRQTSWFTQFYWATWKNCVLIRRKPLILMILLTSSVVSAVFSWLVGRDKEDAIYLPVDNTCAVTNTTVDSSNFEDDDWYYNLQDTQNDRWMTGLPVALLAIGPAMNAVLIFNFLCSEFQLQLLGSLRSLGLRDSVYWTSWLVPFLVIAIINSLLGAITLSMMTGHLYENVYFGGVNGSLFFLQLALIAGSFFLAAVCGTGRKLFSNFAILLIFCALWIPALLVMANWEGGLFWRNRDTSIDDGYGNTFIFYGDDNWRNDFNGTYWNGTDWVTLPTGYWNGTDWVTDTNSTEDMDGPENFRFLRDEEACNQPIMNQEQGRWFKTEAERALVENDEFFVGCYASASWSVEMWNSPLAMLFLVWFPYFHFYNIWGNFAGYTAMPGNEFTSREASLDTAALYAKAIGNDPDPDWGLVTELAPQFSMFYLPDDIWKYRDYNDYEADNNCPLPDHEGANLCENLYECKYAKGSTAALTGPSVVEANLYLCLLALGYLLLAAYWAQVFPGGNGRPEKFYFFLLPSYWCGGGGKTQDDENDTEEGATEGVAIDGIVKQYYDNFQALKGVSFNLAKGEVTALLGHNGAGKTTLARILCCEIPATKGDMTIFGRSISQDPYSARNMIGLCKQDDYLWPNLNAKEHLQLFAGLRGIPDSQIDEKVQKWLQSVDLEVPQLQFASAYSGGMKRRLSLALATIGDRPLIILDEPTTGMDPVSRRFVWRHIEDIKDDRVVLLTTHAMEEADLLADEVAIIRKGELAAIGSPLQLKTEHGSSLQFSLLVDKTAMEETEASIRRFFAKSQEWIDIEPSASGSISLKILKLKEHDDEEGMDVSDLSDFARWLDSDESAVTEYGFSNSSLEEVFLKVTEGDVEEVVEGQAEGGEDAATAIVEEVEEVPMADAESARNKELSSFVPNLSFVSQTITIFRDFMQRSWRGRGSRGNYALFGLFLAGAFLLGLFMGIYDATSGVFIGVVAFLSLPLIVLIGPTYADRAGGQLYLMRSQGLLPSAYIVGAGLYSFAVMFIYGLIMLSAVFATPTFREPLDCEADPDACNWETAGLITPEQTYPDNLYWYRDEYEGQDVNLKVIRSPGGYGKIFGIVLVLALTFPGAVWSSSFLPGFRIPMAIVSFITLGCVFVPVIMAGIFIASPKKTEICYNTTLSPDGICDNQYYLNSTGADFLHCAGVSAMGRYLGAGSLCVPPRSGMLPQFGIFHTLTMTLFARVRFVSEPENYVQDVLIPAITENDSKAKCSGDSCVFPLANELYWGNLIYMLLGAFLLLLLGLLMAVVLEFPIGPVLVVKHKLKAIVDVLLCKKEPIDDASNPTEPEGKDEEMKEVAEEREVVEKIVEPFVDSSDGHHPSIVHSQLDRDNVPAVLAHKLRKVYPALGGRPPKVALSSLDLHVPAGQVLGLLGKNGAGKTTGLKILACAHESSGGIGLIAGYDCAEEKISVFERLGNCAQFDVVWSRRSVQHHLEFFARLKGLPSGEVARAARAIATAVGLGEEEVYQRNAGDLSGGMRRRLSLGLSLIGSPKVVILDEPTTGLDPATRSNIWNLINSFSSNDRSIIITTHMMIEADTLCDRIAIIANGKLKVVGTQQYLKDNFGSGYLLQLNLLNRSSEDRAMAFVRKRLHPNAAIGGRQGKTLRVNLPQDLKLDRVFTALYSKERATEGCINQFLLSQSSLEDVFIALGD